MSKLAGSVLAFFKIKQESLVHTMHRSSHLDMVLWKFIFYTVIALVAPTNGNIDDDLIVDPNGYITYCPCMGKTRITPPK